MKPIVKKSLIGLGLLGVVVVYTMIQVSNSREKSAENATMAGQLAFDEITNSAELPKEKLSKTQAYSESDQLEALKESEIRAIETTEPAKKLTSTFESVYESDYDKKKRAMKERDLTPTYNGSAHDEKVEESKESIFKQTQNQNYTASNRTEKIKVMKSSVPTSRKQEIQTPVENKASDSYFGFVENNSEKTEVVSGEGEESTMIKAAVMGKQNVKSGGVIRFRLLEEVKIKGTVFPRNKVLYAKCSFASERLMAVVEKIETSNGFVPVKLVLHELDLMEGIYAPIKEANEAATDQTLESVEQMLGSAGGTLGQAGTGVARVFRSAAGSGTQKVSVPDAYPVLFLVSN